VSNWPLLSVLIWLPILGGALILAIRDAQTARWASLGVAVLTFVQPLAAERLQPGIDGMQFVETMPGSRRTRSATTWRGRHRRGADPADHLGQRACPDRRLGAIDKRVNQYVAAFLILEGVTSASSPRRTRCCSTCSSRPC
jgi:NADH-quinone oxidoreductase subunit M